MTAPPPAPAATTAAATTAAESEPPNAMEQDSRQLKLTSMDGESFDVACSVACMSELVKTMVQDDQDDDEKQEIPLPNVKGSILKRVIDFITHHHNDPLQEIDKPLKSTDMKKCVPEWDADFIDVEQEELFELILAANYLDIKSLLDLACAKVASMIKGKSPEEVRQTFKIEREFTEEELKQIREESKWCEEA